MVLRTGDHENMTGIIKTDKALEIEAKNGLHVSIEIIGKNIVHCICSRRSIGNMESSTGIIEESVRDLVGNLPDVVMCGSAGQNTGTEPDAPGTNAEFLFGDMTIDTNLSDGRICFRQEGKVLLREGAKSLTEIDVFKYSTEGEAPEIDRVRTVDGERNFIRNLRKIKDHKAYRAKYGFCFDEDEGIYGFGQGEEGVYDHRHQNDYLYQHNMRIPMPMFYSSKGYGMLFDCASLMTFEDDANGSYLFMDAVPGLDYYFISGGNPDAVIDGFRTLTGRAVMLPKWAFGYIQSKEQYYSADELAGTVRHYRNLGIPIDGIVQDWNSWKPGNWGEKILDPERYGDIKEKMDEIHSMHAHAMVSVWPNMNSTTDDYRELSDAGKILNDLSTYDAFDEKAREIYWDQARKGLFDKGFEAWWCDSTEPFSGPDWGGEVKREPWERYSLVGDEHKKYLPQEKANLYALEHAKGIYENQRKTTEEIRVFNLTRSGYASGQKYAALLWSGDISATWETMREQITEGLNMGLSGYPYWTLDIGGFFVVKDNYSKRGCGCSSDKTPKWFWNGDFENGARDFAYREFYVRFLEMGCFLPVFRSHGTDTPREIWNFGKEGEPFYDAIAKNIKLRYEIMPYIYSLAGGVAQRNETMMRSLLFDFGHDRNVVHISDEFMLGRAFLVCPVTSPMYYEPSETDNDSTGVLSKELAGADKTRPVYLPEGCGWTDFRTGVRYDGGQWLKAECPLESIPVYVRDGSIIPMKKNMQYADDKAGDALEIHVYSGCDGDFVLYEDEGNSYRYEDGEFALTYIHWDEKSGKLTTGKRKGSFRGMNEHQEYKVFVDGIIQ